MRALGPLLSAGQAQAREDRERSQELLAQLVEAVQQLSAQTTEVAGAIRAAGVDAVAVLGQTIEQIGVADGDGEDGFADIEGEPEGPGVR